MPASTSTPSSDKADKKKRRPAPYQVRNRDILISKSTRYLIIDFHGEGCFGKVAKCINLITGKVVAVKIHKTSKAHLIQREVEMLDAISDLDAEKKSVIRLLDNFRFRDLSCLVFEMLDRSLFDLMKERKWKQLCLNEIRPVMQQLLVAFEALKGIGILHTDLKLDNIMLVKHKDQPFRIKLIDFGLALPVSKVKDGMIMQPQAYRAPEVTLGLPLSEAVDMWGVGCVVACLYFGFNLFPSKCAYHWMKTMVHLLGQPEDDLLNAGKNTLQYFSREEDSSSPGWRLKSPEEYKETTGIKPQVSQRFFDTAKNLEDAIQSFPAKKDAVEYEDRMAFLSLLKSCLHLDPEKRLTPSEALKHPFITMAHLKDKSDTSSYVEEARQFMTVCPSYHLDESDERASDSNDGLSGTDSSGEDAGIESFSSGRKRKEEENDDGNSDKSSLPQNSIDRNAGGEIFNPGISRGPSPARDFQVGDTAAPNAEESGAPPTKDNGYPIDVCVVIANNTGEDRASAAAGSIDGAAASISLNDGAASANGPLDVDDVKEKRRKKKNLFQRTSSFFRRVKARVVSLFICGKH